VGLEDICRIVSQIEVSLSHPFLFLYKFYLLF